MKLGKKHVLPRREISSVEEFFKIFPAAKEVFIDGTERPIRRPKDNETQRNNYSGKKKRHAKKNIVVCDRGKRIGFLGKTTPGKKHDFSVLKMELPPGLSQATKGKLSEKLYWTTTLLVIQPPTPLSAASKV